MRLALLALAIAALLALAPGAAGAERQVPEGFFGVMWDREIQDTPRDVQDAQWATMAAAGVESARAIFGWDLAQPVARRKPSFERTDVMVERAALHGIDLLPVVTYAPGWAQLVAHEASAPKDVRDYTSYLKALVRRYGPNGTLWTEKPSLPKRPLRAWQIWNEPHLDWQFRPAGGWAERYGALLRASYRTIKKADPKARVVLAGLANVAWESIDKLYRRGKVKGHFDTAALHMYSSTTGDFQQILSRFRAAMDRNGDTKTKVWVTEIGASASASSFQASQQEHMQTTHLGLAKLIPASYRVLAGMRKRHRLTRVYWYTWASGYGPDRSVFSYSGLNAYRPGTNVVPLKALRAYRKAAQALQGCVKNEQGLCRSE
jgi:hypothetical protein